MEQMTEQDNREHAILERILTLKQMVQEERGGPIELHELGVCYFLLNNYRQADLYLSDLLDRFPDYVELAAVYSLRIYCLVREKEYTTAEQLIHERLKVTENDTVILSLLAHVYEKRGQIRESIQLHRRVLNIDPDNSNSLNSAGYLLALHGKREEHDEAYRYLVKALKQRPDHPAYLDSFGMLLAKKGQKENARKALMKALKQSPQNAEILGHLKEILKV